MLLSTYYSQNYASIICQGLIVTLPIDSRHADHTLDPCIIVTLPIDSRHADHTLDPCIIVTLPIDSRSLIEGISYELCMFLYISHLAMEH